MSHARLSVVLRRFGLKEGAATSDLRAAYLRQAHELHPDSCRGQDGSAFISLKRDYDEALELIQRPTPINNARRPSFYQAPPWPPHQTPYGQTARGWDENRSGVSQVTAPPPQLIVFVGTGSLFGLLCSLFSGLAKPERNLSPSPLHDVPASKAQVVRTKSKTKSNVADTESGYYAKRAIKSEPSSIWKSRPHSKHRGSTYVSPVHAAAEDGKAEWLHWVGEANRIPLIQTLDRNQQTPMHYAARNGQYDACAVLYKFGASPHTRDVNGRTPLDLAKEAGHTDVVQMLERGGRGPLESVQYRAKPSNRSRSQGVATC